MKKVIIYAGTACSLLFTACSGEPQKAEEVTVAKTDTVNLPDSSSAAVVETIVPDPEAEKLLARFTKTEIFPYTLDSKKIEQLTKGKELSGEEVKLLSKKLQEKGPSYDAMYTLESFYKIDSIKSHKQYDDYVASLDIGQMKESRCFVLSKISLTDLDYVLFWMNDYSTYEACPYGWGKVVFATSYHKGNIGETIVFAEHSGGADAPVSGETKVKGTLNPDGTIALNKLDENDQGEGEVEINEGNFEIALSKGFFTYTKEENKKPRKRKSKNQLN